MAKINIFSENIYNAWDINEKFFIEKARKILNFYLEQPEIARGCCLSGYKYKVISFDILYCDSVKTHSINKEYRNKDYPADIITFAIFADTDETERFIFDGEINLGEIVLALDKVKEEAVKQGVTDEYELLFLIAHGILHLLGFDHQTEEDYNFVVDKQIQALKAMGYDKIQNTRV
jgi:probable rRNA maturation factor